MDRVRSIASATSFPDFVYQVMTYRILYFRMWYITALHFGYQLFGEPTDRAWFGWHVALGR
jgi:hypothetical protein